MEESSHSGVCQRIAKVRQEVAGPRGKSAFAQQLGISSSTYSYYEAGRVPPADLLVRIAEVGGVDLHWLLTGQASQTSPVPPNHPVLHRAAALLAQHPGSAAPLAAFVDILARSLAFPAKPAHRAADAAVASAVEGAMAEGLSAAVAAAAQSPADAEDASDDSAAAGSILVGRDSWIPILGRSAAGVPQFWSDDAQSQGVTTLRDLARRHAGRQPRRTQPASARPQDNLQETPVQIIVLDAPDEADVVEYVGCPQIKARYPDAFAVRIDGESMSPEIRHGDLVVLSPSAPAVPGRPAVVQLQRQIGLTCKLYQRRGQTVHLVPIHEQFPPQSFPAAQVTWSLRVLARIRPS